MTLIHHALLFSHEILYSVKSLFSILIRFLALDFILFLMLNSRSFEDCHID